MHVFWPYAALAGVDRAYEYLHKFNPRAASHIADTIRDEGDSLANFPHRGRQVRGTDIRELVAAHPYIIRYRIEGEQIFIILIRHSAPFPGAESCPMIRRRIHQIARTASGNGHTSCGKPMAVRKDATNWYWEQAEAMTGKEESEEQRG